MKSMWVVGLVGLSVGVGMVRPAELWGVYRQLYPADPAEQRALNECFTQDPNFNRLNPAAREACYRHNVPALAAEHAQTLRHLPTGNFVDLWRAAGQGHLPQNDVRAEQQNERFLNPTTR
jgi:hypothetical protein